MATKKEREEAEKRSAAARKAAATRKQREEEEAAAKQREEEEATATANESNGDSGSDESNGGDSSEEPQSFATSGNVAEKVGPQRELLSYKPNRAPLENAGLDQQAAEDERQAELAAEREEHNRRTGDASRV